MTLPSDIRLIRYIIYDNKFLTNIKNKTRTDWASISILAHEVAHHLNGHTIDGTGSRPDKELESDEFSGFILAKLGSSLIESQSAINSVASDYQSSTHPNKYSRLEAIKKG